VDELPPDARDLLRLARSEHGPSDLAARARVRASLQRSLGAGAARGGLFKSGALATGAKISMAVLALGAVATLPLWRPRQEPAPRSAESAPRAVPSPAPAEHAPEQPDLGPAHVDALLPPTAPSAEAPPPKLSRPSTSKAVREAGGDSLQGELKLMQSVSEAVARGDHRAADALLGQHQTRYARPLMREEREGFAAMVGCMAQSSGAGAAARAFVRRHPQSLLRARVQRACQGSDAP
jgi:hypothetical protein